MRRKLGDRDALADLQRGVPMPQIVRMKVRDAGRFAGSRQAFLERRSLDLRLVAPATRAPMLPGGGSGSGGTPLQALPPSPRSRAASRAAHRQLQSWSRGAEAETGKSAATPRSGEKPLPGSERQNGTHRLAFGSVCVRDALGAECGRSRLTLAARRLFGGRLRSPSAPHRLVRHSPRAPRT